MTYSRNTIAGLSFAEALNALCSTVTDRWPRFRGDIELGNERSINIYEFEGVRLLDCSRAPKTEAELQRDKDKAAYAAALLPLFDDLASGAVVTSGAPGGDACAPAQQIQARAWRSAWRLIVEGRAVTLHLASATDGKGPVYSLEAIEMIVPPRAVGEVQEAFAPIASTKRRRGPSKDYEPFLAMMENMIRSGEAVGPWQAAKDLVQVKCIVPGSTLDESKIKKLYLEYRRSGDRAPLRGVGAAS